jgi:hypothetical protein
VLAAGARLALDGAATLNFRRAGTSVVPMNPTTALVTSGPHRLTRNPIYLGMAFLHAAFASALGVIRAPASPPAVLVIIDRFVIAREEPYLERKVRPGVPRPQGARPPLAPIPGPCKTRAAPRPPSGRSLGMRARSDAERPLPDPRAHAKSTTQEASSPPTATPDVIPTKALQRAEGSDVAPASPARAAAIVVRDQVAARDDQQLRGGTQSALSTTLLASKTSTRLAGSSSSNSKASALTIEPLVPS